MKRAPIFFLLLFWSSLTLAHRPSDAFLTLRVEGQNISGQWEIALRDLDAAYALDSNADGELTWGELRAAQLRLNDALRTQLKLRSGENPCDLALTDLLIHDRLDGRYAWFALEARCDEAPSTLRLNYDLLFALDPTHRGLLTLSTGSLSHGAVFSPEQRSIAIELSEASSWRMFSDYLREGVHHIWIGLDHILFLLVLLLPCVLVRENGQWRGVERLRPALYEVFAVVTAFTGAHSITLTLAALGLVRLPSAFVESAIALSVLLSALNNIFPRVTLRRWALAFGFGLLHGFGFASVLGELGLPDQLRVLALLAFNLGVELGQLAIVAVAVPLAFALRNHWTYRQVILQTGSALIALIALYWLLQRIGLLGIE